MDRYKKLTNSRVRIQCRSGILVTGVLTGFEFELESCGFLLRLESVRVLGKEYSADVPWLLINPDAVDTCFPAYEGAFESSSGKIE